VEVHRRRPPRRPFPEAGRTPLPPGSGHPRTGAAQGKTGSGAGKGGALGSGRQTCEGHRQAGTPQEGAVGGGSSTMCRMCWCHCGAPRDGAAREESRGKQVAASPILGAVRGVRGETRSCPLLPGCLLSREKACRFSLRAGSSADPLTGVCLCKLQSLLSNSSA